MKCRLFMALLVVTVLAARTPSSFAGEKTSWYGFDRFDFLLDEAALTVQPFKASPDEKNGIKGEVKGQLRCVLIVPKEMAPGKPWSWRGRYFDHEPQTEIELLKRGFHIGFILSDPGKPWDAWYTFLTEKYGLSKRPAFIGMSGGGRNAFTWATTNPDKVACIYADNPLITRESLMRLGELAQRDVPLLHLCGSLDPLLGKYTLPVESIYQQLGGRISVMIKDGARHHPHGLRDPTLIADFIERSVQRASGASPAFAGKKFTRSSFYSGENTYRDFPREGLYITCRGPRFSDSYDRYEFKPESTTGTVIVIAPKLAAPGKPWVLRADFVPRDAVVDLALLHKGFHIVTGPGPRDPDSTVLQEWNAVYKYMIDQGFSTKPVLEGAGQAAGEAYAWAIANPDKVSCVYGENPVLHSNLTKTQLLDNLAPLANAGVHLLYVCGSLDPWLKSQTRVAEKRYQELGGRITIIIKEGEGHYPLAPKEPQAVVDFITKRVAAAGSQSIGKDQKPSVGGADKDLASELPFIPPKSPAEALKAFWLHSGFRIELAAAEPHLASPVAIDFDEDGRLFVAEFVEFNQRDSKQYHGRGRIRLLEDTKGDGVYEKSTVYLDNVDWPTAVCCYDGGVFVGAAPNLLYAKDTKGDGKADIRRVVYTGFARDNVGGEALFNSFRWWFDNRIHVQTSTSGGAVRHAEKKDTRPVSVRGQGFLFDPRTEAFEVSSGGGQYGMSMDDWGRTFVCTSHDPAFLIMYDGRYLSRNPFLEAPAAALRISPGGYTTKVARISPNEPWRIVRTRMRTTGIEPPHPTEGAEPSGYFSAASGVTAYRGDAWPAEYRGNLFVGEVSNNLVYRARLEPNGVSFTAVRAATGPEFLASTDIWFRPVWFANGPDGALYVVDMYRYLVEATETIPSSIVKHLNVGAGFDKGRLYRIVPEGFKRPRTPRLGKASTADLVALLEHPNGWHRDTASRLLYQRQDRAAVQPLKELAAGSKSPLGRMHALYGLDGLKALDVATIQHGLRDLEPRVREHALRLAEQFESDAGIRAQFARMTDDPDLRVRYQLGFSLGAIQCEAPTQALARLARRDGADPWCRLAILSSVNSRAAEVFRLLVENKDFRTAGHGHEMLATLAKLIGSANRESELAAFVQTLNALPESENALLGELVGNLGVKLPASGLAWLTKVGGKSGAVLAGLLRDARKTAPDDERPVADRVTAIRMLRVMEFAAVKDMAPQLLNFRQPQAVQAAIVETLAHFDEAAVPAILLEAWPSLSPQLRASAVEAFFSRPAWIAAFLDAVEQGKINHGDVDPARIQLIQKHPHAKLRDRAAKLFISTKLARRQDVVAAYQKALQLQGDKVRGKAVFKNVCSACHLLEGVGTQVGADLSAIRDQGKDTILLSILDPNREVKPQFLSYILATKSGRSFTGMITAETANSITIRQADRTSETVLRRDIEELQSTGLSYMPEGLEKQIDVPSMADLLAYLKSTK